MANTTLSFGKVIASLLYFEVQRRPNNRGDRSVPHRRPVLPPVSSVSHAGVTGCRHVASKLNELETQPPDAPSTVPLRAVSNAAYQGPVRLSASSHHGARVQERAEGNAFIRSSEASVPMPESEHRPNASTLPIGGEPNHIGNQPGEGRACFVALSAASRSILSVRHVGSRWHDRIRRGHRQPRERADIGHCQQSRDRVC